MIKITAPKPYSGPSVVGPTTLAFDEGVAYAPTLIPGVRAYLEGAGYKVEDEDEAPAKKPAAKKADA